MCSSSPKIPDPIPPAVPPPPPTATAQTVKKKDKNKLKSTGGSKKAGVSGLTVRRSTVNTNSAGAGAKYS